MWFLFQKSSFILIILGPVCVYVSYMYVCFVGKMQNSDNHLLDCWTWTISLPQVPWNLTPFFIASKSAINPSTSAYFVLSFTLISSGSISPCLSGFWNLLLSFILSNIHAFPNSIRLHWCQIDDSCPWNWHDFLQWQSGEKVSSHQHYSIYYLVGKIDWYYPLKF